MIPMTNLAIDSREVAVMVEKDHSHLLRDIRTYIEHMQDSTESKIGFSEFFLETSYVDSTGRNLPCYDVTRKGCEFIANKLTGRKGTIFTATYINRFHEMESLAAATLHPPYTEAKAVSLGEAANVMKILIGVMKLQHIAPHRIAQQVRLSCQQFGIRTIPEFVASPIFTQASLPAIPLEAMIQSE